uniref:Cytochrome c oxidase assembly protein COX16 homolog, mitochondrial n=1 Tax=Sphenodon punctatus TaxID=8508 RepID=A0A8D0G507_SPHPU
MGQFLPEAVFSIVLCLFSDYHPDLFSFCLKFQILIVGGSFGLREFSQIRYDAAKRGKLSPVLEERVKKSNVTLESEYEKMKDSNLEEWKNIRGPRPWEDSKAFQDQQRKELSPKPA